MTTDTLTEVRAKLTLTEIGVILSLLSTTGVGIFSLGVVYGQVQENSDSIAKIEPKVETVERRIERIDANVQFLRDLESRRHQNNQN